MNHWIFWCIAICFSIVMVTGGSPSAEKPVIVNVLVDHDIPASNSQNIWAIFGIFGSSNWTLILTENAATIDRNTIGMLTPSKVMELGISGNHSNEKMSTESYTEQKTELERAKERVELCKICGINEVIVKGYMPQLYDQNEDTYKALDNLGIVYDAGFKAGILYAPGHENDVWPYKVENHNFYAVPISTYTLSGEKVTLDDREIKDKGLSPSKWYDLLVGKFDEVSGKDEPMIVSLHTSISGTGDYLNTLKQFFNYATSNNARFVNTSVLVSMSIKGVHSAMPFSSVKSGCAECDAMKNNTNITANITTDVIKV